MDSNEIKKYFANDMLRFGARNKEKHVIISIGKTKFSFINFLTDANSVLNGAKHSLKSLNEYCLKDEFDEIVFNQKARGIRFEYVADDGVHQLGEMLAVKLKNNFYIIYCACQLSRTDEMLQLFKKFRDSLKLE